MSVSDQSNSRPDTGDRSGGILGNLPSTRPQRLSARRSAAKPKTVAKRKPAVKRSSVEGSSKSDGAARARRAPARHHVSRADTTRAEPAPRQGFEVETDLELGVAVQPPSGPEVIASALGLAGELAQSGLFGGARMLKSALSRLPRP
ncbi:MAG TPA: hypothetical protein VLJ42_07335 [Solirubrobacteraceae bacterium]|nr:hypothetical protein [Solirubrobacteraceae bacterium]